MYRTFAIVVAVTFALLALVVGARPSRFQVRRELRLAAPPERVFPHLDAVDRWEAWFPWPGGAPPTFEYGPVRRGVGATRAFRGTPAQGSGSLSVVESRAPEHLLVELRYAEPPDSGRHTLRFTVAPLGAGSLVTAAYEGEHTLAAKAVALVVDAKHFVGVDLDAALAGLKTVAEAPADAPADVQPSAEGAAAASDAGSP